MYFSKKGPTYLLTLSKSNREAEAPVMIAEKMRELGMEVIDPVLRIQYQPVEKDLEECKRLGKDIAVKIKKKYTRAGSEPKHGDTPIMHEVKMGEGSH